MTHRNANDNNPRPTGMACAAYALGFWAIGGGLAVLVLGILVGGM